MDDQNEGRGCDSLMEERGRDGRRDKQRWSYGVRWMDREDRGGRDGHPSVY